MFNEEAIREAVEHRSKWTIRKFVDDAMYQAWLKAGQPEKGFVGPYETIEIEGNILLNEGITALQNLLTGAAETDYGNTNAYLGVGSDNTAEVATQTGLIDGTPTHKAMEATYPQISAQTTTWRSVFGSADANEAWEEFTVVNASSDAGDNLNRKTSSQGTKTVGQTWTLDLAITWS